MKMQHRTLITLGAILVTGISLTACAPGGSSASDEVELGDVSTDVAAAGDITLTVWDQNTDPGIDDAQVALNEAFMEEYPNVTIERVARSFADLKTTLGLALDSPDAPDVVQANQGYPDMGTFVEAGLLRPLNDYAELYGWTERYPATQLALNSFSADGSQWQGENLYGVSQTGEIVGVYYNKAMLAELGLEIPQTLEDFEAALAIAADAGIQPLEFGNTEKSPGIHLYGIVQAALAGGDGVNDLVSGKTGAWTDDVSVEAAATIQSWVESGYLPDGTSGISRDAARAAFEEGGSLFYVDGTWRLAEVQETMGEDGGFFALSSADSEGPVTTGGVGLAWAMTSKPESADAAAAYIDFITNAQASEVLTEWGNLPAIVPDDYEPAANTTEADVVAEWRTVGESGALVPYLDYATPTFYDTLTAAVQELLAGRVSPDEFTQTLQDDYEAFLSE